MPAGVTGNVQFTYYDIHGNSIRELMRQIRDNELVATGTTRAVAVTSWKLAWNWRAAPLGGGGGCALNNIDVRLDVEYAMPRWSPPDDASSQLRRWWDGYLARLEVHESHHKDIAADAGKEIVRLLRSVKGNCNTINFDASSGASEIYQRSRRLEEEFDIEERRRTDDPLKALRDSLLRASRP